MKKKSKISESMPIHRGWGKASKGLLTGCVLAAGFVTEGLKAVDVPADADLRPYLVGATAEAHDFNLLGDVTLLSTFTMNLARYANIYIEGNGHTITRYSQNDDFWIHLSNAHLTIKNAIITPRLDSGTSWGSISIDTGRRDNVLDLDGTTFLGNIGADGYYSGGITSFARGTIAHGNILFEGNHTGGGAAAVSVAYDSDASLKFTGEVTFLGNYATTSGAGAVAVNNNGTLNFDNVVVFKENHSAQTGGALWLDDNAHATFSAAVTFSDNYSGRRGGAIQIDHANSVVLFEDNVTFSGNYVRGNNADAPRGGAVSIGNSTATTQQPQLVVEGRGEFIGNYVWGEGSRNGYGGAIALTSHDNATGTNNLNNSHIYGIDLAQGVFEANYAHSETASGYGGAVFSQSYQSVLSFGSGSAFTENAASTLGGAIYFNQGTINLTGNVEFSGNRHGVAFATESGKPVPDMNTGTANAIYFSSVSNTAHTATLNMTTGSGELIDFSDPIESAANRSVVVRHSGDGTVRFSGHNSDILAQTEILGGTFELGEGVAYGRTGTSATSNFTLNAGANLVGGAGSSLIATEQVLDGRVESTSGVFNLVGSNIVMSATTEVVINIFDQTNYSSFNVQDALLQLNGATLEVIATYYTPSQELDDSFIIVTGLSSASMMKFAQGDTIEIKGALFEIVYNSNNILLQQLTVPEPSTYALILAIGCVGVAMVRRQRGKR